MQYMTPESKVFKLAVFDACRVAKFNDDKESYNLVIEFHSSSWRNKDKTIKRRDATNYVKIAEDALSEALHVDDSRFWQVTAIKVESDKEMTIYRLA